MTDRELMQQALDAMMTVSNYDALHEAKIALRERLAHCDRCGKRHGGDGHIHTCTPPAAQRTWVGLTDDEKADIAAQGHQRWKEHAQAIEAKLKEKNCGN